MTSTEHVCFVYHLTPGSGPEYDRRHEQVWPTVLDALTAQGVQDYSIFRRGDLVISVLRRPPVPLEVPTALVEAQRAWSDSLAPLFESIVDIRGLELDAAPVFRFEGVSSTTDEGRAL